MITKNKQAGYLFIGGVWDGERHYTDGSIGWTVVKMCDNYRDGTRVVYPKVDPNDDTFPILTCSTVSRDVYNQRSFGGTTVYVHEELSTTDDLLSHFISTYRKRKTSKRPRKKDIQDLISSISSIIAQS